MDADEEMIVMIVKIELRLATSFSFNMMTGKLNPNSNLQADKISHG